MYKSLKIKNYRAITKIEIDNLSTINLFVGKNNCGKSSLLEAILLLSSGASVKSLNQVNTVRGMPLMDLNILALLFNDLNVNEDILLIGKHSINGDIYTTYPRSVRISSQLNKAESLNSIIDSSGFIKDLSSSAHATPLQGDPLNGEGGLSTSSSFVNNLVRIFSYFDKQDSKTKESKSLIKNDFWGSSAGSIPSESLIPGIFISGQPSNVDARLQYHNARIEKRTAEIVDVLKDIEPNLTELHLGAEGVVYCDIGLRTLVPLNVIGDGFVRLFYIILAISAMRNGIVLIDEIDTGLFHSTLNIMWKSVIMAAKKFSVQVFATTHSLECVQSLAQIELEKLFKPEEDIRLYRIERGVDKFRAIAYTKDELQTTLDSGWEFR